MIFDDIPGFTPAVRLDCQSVATGARPKRRILFFVYFGFNSSKYLLK